MKDSCNGCNWFKFNEGSEYRSSQNDDSIVIESNLNKDFTFENFIVGTSNKFAHAAALAVAEKPGTLYNPLFIYGNSGLGKTHLMHAIGNYIEKHSNKKVLYITSETFVNDFIEITRKKKEKSIFENIDFFKKKYRDIDVLIVDDIQFLAKKNESQKEFFHTFNNLYDDGKQIIISSDRSPNDLKIFEERLRTRFNWGLPVNIYPSDIKTKQDIVEKNINKSLYNKYDISKIIDSIAASSPNNISLLLSTIHKLEGYAKAKNYIIEFDNLNSLLLSSMTFRDYE